MMSIHWMLQMILYTGIHLMNSLTTLFKDLFSAFFIAFNAITLFHMIANCNLSLKYEITIAHSAKILINAFTVWDDTHNTKHSVSKCIAKQACLQVIT